MEEEEWRREEERGGKEAKEEQVRLSQTLTSDHHQLVLRHGWSWGGNLATRTPNLPYAGLQAGWGHYMSGIIGVHQTDTHSPTILPSGVPIIRGYIFSHLSLFHTDLRVIKVREGVIIAVFRGVIYGEGAGRLGGEWERV